MNNRQRYTAGRIEKSRSVTKVQTKFAEAKAPPRPGALGARPSQGRAAGRSEGDHGRASLAAPLTGGACHYVAPPLLRGLGGTMSHLPWDGALRNLVARTSSFIAAFLTTSNLFSLSVLTQSQTTPPDLVEVDPTQMTDPTVAGVHARIADTNAT
ncbi:hypothetical protein PGTUg99_003192 [Puccinia graminis f. sp. tritici]|uniref:Uncharacterized protein n=1 Tax=Puccinia graminis f. sp. tritici TaxID=56615 RepID=A0A5B0RCD9_PUCGR|nr:hypothetical protein PGTUg99_003192 [Puccinia graminis f. sp. tritici]